MGTENETEFGEAWRFSENPVRFPMLSGALNSFTRKDKEDVALSGRIHPSAFLSPQC